MADIIIDGTTIASKSGSTVSLQNINSGSFSSELTIPSGTSRPSSPSIGSVFYNSNIDKNRCEMYVGQDQWIPLWYRYHWMRPEKTSGYSGGTFSADGQVWFSENATKTNYGAVILNRVFPGDFTVIAKWGRDYDGVGMVYRDNASLNDFQSSSSDGHGLYWGNLNTSGFGYNNSPAYGFIGQYPAPISSQGDDAGANIYYFKLERSGNTLTLQYNTDNGSSWTNFNNNHTATITSSNGVICGFGEAHNVEVVPLTLISVSEG